MANNGTAVSDLKVSVVKVEELKISAKGKPYLQMSLVHEDDGAKTWFKGVAFGVLASAISKKVTKGNKMKVNGMVSQKEYKKKDDTIGVENSLIVNSAKVSNGVTVEILDEFSA